MNRATTGAPSGPRYHAPAFRAFILLALLALLVNAGLFWFAGQNGASLLTPRNEQSQEVILATLVNEQRALVATLGNQVILLESGQPIQQMPVENLVGGLAVAADQQTFYVGTSDGKIARYNDTLQLEQTVTVNGRVVGLKAAAPDGFIVAHGIGAFSDRYYVSYFPAAATEATFTTRVEFTIAALAVAADGTAFYGTANARVGALDPAGEERWKVKLKQTPTQLLVLPQNRLLVGDEKGNLTLLDPTGAIAWTVKLSEYPLRSLAYDSPSQTLLAGDGHGTIFAVDSAGQQRIAQALGVSDIVALLPLHPGEWIAVPSDGPWATLNTAAIGSAGLAEEVRWVLYGVNGVLLIALLSLLVLTVQRWRIYSMRQLGWMWRQRIAYLFVLPSFALILVFSYYPASLALYYSFTNFSTRGVTEFIGLENYQRILTQDFYFRVGFTNMLLMVITNIAKTFTMPLLVAELIFSLRNAVHRYLFRTLFVLPAVVPGLIIVFLWRMVYDPYVGLLNQVLGALGLSAWQHAWLGEERTALWAIIGAGFPYIGAFPFLIFLGGLLNISPELYDAAKIDGATWWSRFWFVDVPLLMPQFRLLLFFSFAGAIQSFAQVYIYTRGGPGYATYVPGLQMYFQIGDGDFGYASAIGVLLFVLIFLGTVFILRFRRQAIEVQ